MPRPDEPPSVFVEGDTPEFRFYELDRILNKRIVRKGRGFATEYLIKWKGYGPQHDVWRNEKYLDNARDLIQDYEEAGKPRQITAPTSDVDSRTPESDNQIVAPKEASSAGSRTLDSRQPILPTEPRGPEVQLVKSRMVAVRVPIKSTSQAEEISRVKLLSSESRMLTVVVPNQANQIPSLESGRKKEDVSTSKILPAPLNRLLLTQGSS